MNRNGTTAPRDPVAQILAYNRQFLDRYALPLRQKVERMSSGPFGFFRGSFHLFAQDLLDGLVDPWKSDNTFPSVVIPIVGDIHVENYGTYKAADGTVRFDINDFDETTVGSFDFDCKRAATSLYLAAHESGRTLADATSICESFVRAYVRSQIRFAKKKDAPTFGYSDLNPPPAKSVEDLLKEAAQIRRPEWVEKVTVLTKGKRLIKRGPKYFDLKPNHRAQAERLYQDYVRRVQGPRDPDQGYYQPLDFAGRVAGCGSLGRLRYAVLLEGEGSDAAKNVILEIKESLPSAYDTVRGHALDHVAQHLRAEQVTRAVLWMQTASNRHLGYAVDRDQSFQVREIGPREARLDWSEISKADQVGCVYAELLAKAHAKADANRSFGKGEREIVPFLQEKEDVFVKRITAFALAYSEQVEEDHRLFQSRRKEVERALVG